MARVQQPRARVRSVRTTGWDTGSATIWVLTICVVIWFSAFAVVLVASVRTDRHRAATAADLAALAGAENAMRGAERACTTARHVARANDAYLTDCALTGVTVSVRVRVQTRMWPGDVSARARAGPTRSA